MIPFVNKFLLSREAVQRHIDRSPLYLLGRMALYATVSATETHFGAFSGVLLGSFGANCICCRKWQDEVGVWMLSGFLLLCSCVLYTMMAYYSVVDENESVTIVEVVEVSACTAIVWLSVRFSGSLMRFNWRYTRRCATAKRLGLCLCVKCGYDLRATKDRCPEWGEEIGSTDVAS